MAHMQPKAWNDNKIIFMFNFLLIKNDRWVSFCMHFTRNDNI